MPNRWIPAFLIGALLMSAAGAADIGVSPPRAALTVPRGGSVTTTFTVVWTGHDTVRLSLSKSDWTLDPSGKMMTLPLGQGQHSASGWVTMDADSVVMSGAGQKTVRVNVHVPDDPSLAGTYRTVLFVTTPAPPANGKGATITMRERVGVVLYVTVAGTQTQGSKLADLYLDGSAAHAVVQNDGNTLMRCSGSLEVRDASGKTVKTVPVGDAPVLRGSERDIRMALPSLPSGYYVLLLMLKDSRGGKLLTGQIPYEVK